MRLYSVAYCTESFRNADGMYITMTQTPEHGVSVFQSPPLGLLCRITQLFLSTSLPTAPTNSSSFLTYSNWASHFIARSFALLLSVWGIIKTIPQTKAISSPRILLPLTRFF